MCDIRDVKMTLPPDGLNDITGNIFKHFVGKFQSLQDEK